MHRGLKSHSFPLESAPELTSATQADSLAVPRRPQQGLLKKEFELGSEQRKQAKMSYRGMTREMKRSNNAEKANSPGERWVGR